MKLILIVSDNPDLARIWAKHLERQHQNVVVTTEQTDAIEFIRENPVDVILLDLMIAQAGAFFLADYVSYRRPDSRIVFVTKRSFFSDASLFKQVPNTAAVLQEDTPPKDLAEIVAYHGRAS